MNATFKTQQLFDEIYVINLDKSTDRLTNVSNELKKLDFNFKRFSAIDGKKISNKELDIFVSSLCKTYCTPSMIGCAMSHLKLWQLIYDLEYEKVLIFEDDIKAQYDKETTYDTIKNMMNKLPNDWDILFLGCFFCNDSALKPTLSHLKGFHGGMHSYVVSKRGVKKLLEHNTKIFYHIDFQLLITSPNLNKYYINPQLFVQNTNLNSNIGHSGFLKEILNKLSSETLPLGNVLSEPIINYKYFEISSLTIITFILLFFIFKLVQKRSF